MHNTENKILFSFSEDLDVDFLQDLYGDDFSPREFIKDITDSFIVFNSNEPDDKNGNKLQKFLSSLWSLVSEICNMINSSKYAKIISQLNSLG